MIKPKLVSFEWNELPDEGVMLGFEFEDDRGQQFTVSIGADSTATGRDCMRALVQAAREMSELARRAEVPPLKEPFSVNLLPEDSSHVH